MYLVYFGGCIFAFLQMFLIFFVEKSQNIKHAILTIFNCTAQGH